MDIKLPLDANLQLAVNKSNDGSLGLKLNQVVEAKVIENQTMLDTLTLQIKDKTVTAQTKLAIDIQPGQSLRLQVIKLLPVPELKLISSLLPPSTAPDPAQNNDELTLTLLNKPVATPLPASPPLKNAPAAAPPPLNSGQQLQAIVIAAADDKVTLQLAPPAAAHPQTGRPEVWLLTLDTNQLLSGTDKTAIAQKPDQAAIPLKEGMQLRLEVVKSGDRPVFLLSSASAKPEQQVVEAYKQMLPIQASPAGFINQLQQSLPALLADASLSETLLTLAQKILTSIPASSQLAEPPILSRVFKESGLFMEAKLLELLLGKPNLSLQDDFKFKLSKLIQLLTQELTTQIADKSALSNELLKESLEKAQSAYAKLTLDQLNSLPKEESPKQTWTLELPFFHNGRSESVKIEIERDKSKSTDSSEKNWVVNITITPPDLGTIHCRISYYDDSVNTRFWSEVAGTAEIINAHLDYLKHQFETKGLNPGFMEAHQGQPTQTDPVKTPMPHLLSEKA
ncbi:flagellar hook-length control protein FliK [Methylomonas sp. MgM2]